MEIVSDVSTVPLNSIERFEYCILLELLRELAKDEYDVNLAGRAKAILTEFKCNWTTAKRTYLSIVIRFYSGNELSGLQSHDICIQFDDSSEFGPGSILKVTRIESLSPNNYKQIAERWAALFELADPQCFEQVLAHLKSLLNQPWMTKRKRKLSRRALV